jgi:hypothetical protein
LIVEHALNVEVLDSVEVVKVVELEVVEVVLWLLEVVDDTTLEEELEEATKEGGPVF